MSNYDDIINLPHPISKKHPQMPIRNRAAQFAPFAALSGYGDAVSESARLTDTEIVLDDDEKELLDEKFSYIQEHLMNKQEVNITYYIPDEKKSGGSYKTVTKLVKKIDSYRRCIILDDDTTISIESIIEIDW